MGHRLRLYARVLVLEDANGSRLALVVADIPLGSALVHRRVAELLSSTDRIGVDRLIVAATHTHSGPGHYMEGKVYNLEGSSVAGYDAAMVDSLARRIAQAVDSAVARLTNAQIAWGSTRIWGLTRIRSLPAMARNIPPPTVAPGAPDSMLPEFRFVDPELSMLRVDLWDPRLNDYVPAGAFSIFAMHGTGNATATELLDADIHGLVERRLERYIDEQNHVPAHPFAPKAVHLFANGMEGDVSPGWTPQSRCEVPPLTSFPFLDGPVGNRLWQWRPSTPEYLAACNRAARQAIAIIGDSVGALAVNLFKSLRPGPSTNIELSRSYESLPLYDSAAKYSICTHPAVGMQALIGGPDARTRMNHVKLFGVFPIGFEEGSTNNDMRGCHKQKHTVFDVLFGEAFNTAFVADQLPRFAQVSLFQIGDRVIGTLPGEVTTTAGRRMRREMMDSALASRPGIATALLMGLTNGYMEYITTAEEYTAQFYEGGSTLYGPGEAAMFGHALARLIPKLSAGDLKDPKDQFFAADPGPQKEILHQPKDPKPKRPPSIETSWCSGDTLYVNFRMGAAHDWPSDDGTPSAVPRIEVLDGGGAAVLAGEDDRDVELYLRSFKKDPAKWRMQWSGMQWGVPYNIRLSGSGITHSITCSHK